MEQGWQILWGVLGTLVTALVGWLSTYLVSLLNAKIKDQKLKTFLTKFTEIITTSVNSLSQTVVDSLKKNGSWTGVDGEKVKKDCIDLVKKQLTPDMIKFIQDNWGDLGEFISNSIESFIFSTKKSLPAAK